MLPISFPDFPFNSPLAKTIIELERVRGDLGLGTTHPALFEQLRSMVQLMSTITSARIEGNRTSIVDAVAGVARSRRLDGMRQSDQVQEIVQLHAATAFVDETISTGTPLTHALVRELHRVSVEGLQREGDRTPGSYRTGDVSISGSRHAPPGPNSVHGDMTELLEFLNRDVDRSLQLLKIAIAHHRFVWIHPFGNGNGRVGRLLTYAAMRREGFTDDSGYRVLNPTAVFGANRALYYERLEDADSLAPDAIIRWCEYVLNGLVDDLERMRRLSQSEFVTQGVLLPSIRRGLRSAQFDQADAHALAIIAERLEAKSADLEPAYPGSSTWRSKKIRTLLDRGLIEPVTEGGRIYRLRLAPSELTPLVFRQLDDIRFLPRILRDE
ncbi:Fic family protein [Sinomonas sp. JGH33]|uniref:Fic family protein n=1 Tax=Sinomonas terricola TaxID=3110330 RepID=A0ABU5T4U2_9MICC|nr:Fic family protein [Sinomonas sp. JGH33]MEA5454681.1 Fic family protein [Sinomonas sp. JGH33]